MRDGPKTERAVRAGVEPLERRRLFAVGVRSVGSLGSDDPIQSAGTDVAVDAAGNVYATAHAATGDAGTVYRIPAAIVASAGTPPAGAAAVASFGTDVVATNTVGSDPTGQLVVDAAGDLFGVTLSGAGPNGNGTLWELPAGGSAVRVLYQFAAPMYYPGGLQIDRAGNLFGSAFEPNQGTVLFEYPADGTGLRILTSPGTAYGDQTVVTPDGDVYGLNPIPAPTGPTPVGYELYRIPAAAVAAASAAAPATPQPLAGFTSAEQGQAVGLAVTDGGNAYVTTSDAGGAYGAGAVLERVAGATDFRRLASVTADGQLESRPTVDAAGNVFATARQVRAADGRATTGTTGFVVEVPIGSGAVQTLVPIPGLVRPGSLEPDAAGNLYGVTAGGGLTSADAVSSVVYQVTGQPYAVAPTITPTPTPVMVTAGVPTVPATLSPGESTTVGLTVANTGPTAVSGRARVTLYASSTGTVAGGRLLRAQTVVLSLPAGGSRSVAVPVRLPVSTPFGSTTILAVLSPLGRTATGAVPTATVALAQVARQFGTVGTRRSVRVTLPASGGGRVTYALAGPGTGVLGTAADGNPTVSLTGTTAATAVSVTPTRRSADRVTLAAVAAPVGSLGRFIAPQVNLAGSMAVGGNVGSLALHDLTGADVAFNVGTTFVQPDRAAVATVTLGTVTDSSVDTGGNLTSLTVAAWLNVARTAAQSSLMANRLDAVVCHGGFGGSATALARIGTVAVDGGLTGQFVSDTTIGTVAVGGNFDGVVVATSALDALTVAGDVLVGTVEVGAQNVHTGAGPGPFTIGTIDVRGTVRSSFYAVAGLLNTAPLDEPPQESLEPNGSIGSVTLAHVTDGAAVQVFAATLPPTATIDGVPAATAGDPRFTYG